MKKYPPGFAPIDFKLGGRILFPVSLILILLGALDYLMKWNTILSAMLFIGLVLLILSLYWLFVVPKE